MFFKKRSFPEAGLGKSLNAYAAYITLLCLCCLLHTRAVAQKEKPHNLAPKPDTTKDKLNLTAQSLYHFKTDTDEVVKFIGSAVFQQGTDTLYCDSLYQHKPGNVIEAFSNVRIAQQGGTQGTSDYLRYTSAKKLAYMSGHVSLTDGHNKLTCAELNYDMGNKIGVYSNGGNLKSDSTTVSSNEGIYNVKTKESRFKGNVVIIDPQYKIRSEDIGYNTETKFESFYSHSIVTSDSGKSVLETTSGTYDSKKGIAHFLSRSSIWNDGQYIEGDSLHYNKLTGYGLGIGKVISIDTAHHSKMICGRLEYFQKKRVLWATIKPVLQQVNGKDTLYMRADTFYSAPMVKTKVLVKKSTAKDSTGVKDSLVSNAGMPADSSARQHSAAHVSEVKAVPSSYAPEETKKGRSKTKRNEAKTDTTAITKIVYAVPGSETDNTRGSGKKTKRKKGIPTEQEVAADTSRADTTAPLYFIGYHHVLIFSDSLQGKCDSVCYTRADSTIRMMYAPIAWAHNSQITGDTILLHLDSSSLRSLYVPNNAFVVSQSGPEKAKLFDQVQGKTLTAYFKDNAITRAVVFPNAESIYFPLDEKNAYMGMNQSKSERMRIFFQDQKITKIKLEQECETTMTPMEMADLPGAKLSRFKWLIDQRPKTKEELFK